MTATSPDITLPAEAADFVRKEISSFTRDSPLNRMPTPGNDIIFDEPLVQFARGDDHIFHEYKAVVHPTHLTPREALALSCNSQPEDMPASLSVISWILPITGKTRRTNRRRKKTPSLVWAYTRWYGEKLHNALREHIVRAITERGFRAVSPVLEPYYKVTLQTGDNGYYSNWSERHIAFAAGLGTFGLSDGFITERGISHRCGSVVTDLYLPASPRTASSLYANCLFYITGKCRACIERCPSGAITEQGHDKAKCYENLSLRQRHLYQKYGVGASGCGLCQTKVPCESGNPVKKLKKTAP